MSNMTVNVALSPVPMLMTARMVRRRLNGFIVAENRIMNGFGRFSAAHMLRPCCARAERAASSERPRGLHSGLRL